MAARSDATDSGKKVPADAAPTRGGAQIVPRPPGARPGPPAPWAGLDEPARVVDLARVRRALATTPLRPSLVERSGGRAAAVLVPLWEEGGTAWVLLTRRAAHLRTHKGEVSFPGGGQDPGESLTDTALREAWEEVALNPATVELVGELDHVSTATSAAYIVPYVGFLPGRPAGLVASPGEVGEILLVPLTELLLDEVFREELWAFEDSSSRSMHFFELVGDTVWGATARILHQFLALVLET